MEYDRVEWGEFNLEHATRRATRREIEQVIRNADRTQRHPKTGRVLFKATTDGGRRLTVIADQVRDGVRPVMVLEGWR